MKTVWTFSLNLDDFKELLVPEGATPLTVQVQGGSVCLWMLVDPTAPTETRRYRIAGTGHPISEKYALGYIGTFQLAEGTRVFHVFEASL